MRQLSGRGLFHRLPVSLYENGQSWRRMISTLNTGNAAARLVSWSHLILSGLLFSTSDNASDPLRSLSTDVTIQRTF